MNCEKIMKGLKRKELAYGKEFIILNYLYLMNNVF